MSSIMDQDRVNWGAILHDPHNGGRASAKDNTDVVHTHAYYDTERNREPTMKGLLGADLPKALSPQAYAGVLNAPQAQSPRDALTAQERKNAPMARGLLDYFPDALMAVAELSRVANDQHNPGQPMHWSKGKSNDHADSLMRHLIDRGMIDTDGQRHSVKVAWRALANLQIELEAARNG